MQTSSKAALAFAALALTAAAVAQDRPESILPPGFGEPSPPPAPSATPSARPSGATAPSGTSSAPRPRVVSPPSGAATPGGAPAIGLPAPVATDPLTGEPIPGVEPAAIDPALLRQYELPDYARRSTDRVGVAARPDAFPADAFGDADGAYLQRLMRRLDAPLPSRWMSIALRRLLMSAVDTPAGVDGADFAGERVWLLVRMGEAMGARAMAQAVDPDRATTKLATMTMQAGLAAGDPAALCPYAADGFDKTGERGWKLAQAMCAGLSGVPGEAGRLLEQVRRQKLAGGMNFNLAEKVVSAGAGSRRSVTIEWTGVDRLNIWRYGLAAATATEIPANLLSGGPPQLRHWYALSPFYSASDRARYADLAAAQGILSNLALVDLYSEIAEAEDASSTAGTIAADLRAAYVAPTANERLTALKSLWGEPVRTAARYGRLVLTARAAARLRPFDAGGDTDTLIAAILTAGFDRSARRWSGNVSAGGDGWAMLMASDPAMTQVSGGDVDDYSGDDAKRNMLYAALAGMGRIAADDVADEADSYGINLEHSDPWTQAIDRAAQANQPGTVILLAAAGMQTPDWTGVGPTAFYHIIRALHATGQDGYARMLAAEAIARL